MYKNILIGIIPGFLLSIIIILGLDHESKQSFSIPKNVSYYEYYDVLYIGPKSLAEQGPVLVVSCFSNYEWIEATELLPVKRTCGTEPHSR
ncbi:MAG: hypothetical protein WD512_19555 [Candidatus Paceibacterota bacterium]